MKLTVAVQPPYPIFIESGVLGHLAEYIGARRVALISDEHVAPLHAERVCSRLRESGKQVSSYTVPAGEASKSLEVFTGLLRQLAQEGLERTSAILALGGGVVGDLAGFTAASYLRGVTFYQCPTSLLAMVDSSVGGKAGVNLPEGKNLVGAFWQPKAVFADVSTLASLPEREFKQGAVELFKHGLLADPTILEDWPDTRFRPDGPTGFLTDLIARSVQVKADIVAADEREQGVRATLNLGHNLGHALEAYSHHRLSHGDAVAYGLLFAAKLAAQRGWADEIARVRAFLAWLKPPPLPPCTLRELKPYLARDKKTRGGAQRWVLLERLGCPRVVGDVGEGELEAAWNYLAGDSRSKI